MHEKNEESASKGQGINNIDGSQLMEQQFRTFETLEELKGRMSKLEHMFSQIL
jgi:hypothetical protein